MINNIEYKGCFTISHNTTDINANISEKISNFLISLIPLLKLLKKITKQTNPITKLGKAPQPPLFVI